jgi:hypothetical protein
LPLASKREQRRIGGPGKITLIAILSRVLARDRLRERADAALARGVDRFARRADPARIRGGSRSARARGHRGAAPRA